MTVKPQIVDAAKGAGCSEAVAEAVGNAAAPAIDSMIQGLVSARDSAGADYNKLVGEIDGLRSRAVAAEAENQRLSARVSELGESLAKQMAK